MENNFFSELENAMDNCQGSSAYRNDRQRPYDGQPWTDSGERGRTEVKGLTMRDIKDCFIVAVLQSYPCDEYLKADNFIRCWDWGSEGGKRPTEFLLSKQNELGYICVKAELGTWVPSDLYKLDLSKIDPIAVSQNLTCNIEKMMGIFPNFTIGRPPTRPA